MLSNVDAKQLTVLVKLDISSAFDISHPKLLKWLQEESGVSGLALSCIESYLSNQFQFVKIGKHASTSIWCDSGVSQGSVLGPLLFIIYVSCVGDTITRLKLRNHQYADANLTSHIATEPEVSASESLDVRAPYKYVYLLTWGRSV